MTNSWFLLQTSAHAPAYNMALDEALLEAAPRLGRPVLRFYGWTEAAATFGYIQKHEEAARWTSLRPLIRRPTGGGLVLHEADWTYSLVFPPSHTWYCHNALESYQRLHEWIRASFAKLSVPTKLSDCSQKELPGQCFAGADRLDVLWRGRKIAGAARRRTRHGLLIQGSVQSQPLWVSREQWHEAMKQSAAETLAIEWMEIPVDAALQTRALELAETKYSRPSYNQRR